VADAGAGRNDAEILECLGAPPEKLVTLAIPRELSLGVDEIRRLGAVLIHLHRVVDDEINRLKGVDPFRVAAE
jgi:hypothetical protein